jgi:hypothetical protein
MDSANIPPYARNARPLAQLLVLLGTLAMTACAHGEIVTLRPGETAALSGKVSSVTVTSAGVPLERLVVYEDIDANRTIEETIVSRLVEDDHFDESGDLKISVRINGFRLRSTGNAFWAGAMAGIDKLEGEVDIQQGEGHTNYYDFKSSGSEEWYFKYGSGARFRSLARVLAEKISMLFEGEDVAE